MERTTEISIQHSSSDDEACAQTTVTGAELAPASPSAAALEERAVPAPRPRERHGYLSIIEAPKLRENLGLVGPDGGAAPPPAAIVRPIPRVNHPAIEDDVPGETSHEGPPSAADPMTWAGSSYWPSQ